MNSTNYNVMSRTPSVHWGRQNVCAAYHNNATNRAMRAYAAPPPPQPIMFVPGGTQCCHGSSLGNTLTTIGTGMSGLAAGYAVGSGQPGGLYGFGAWLMNLGMTIGNKCNLGGCGSPWGMGGMNMGMGMGMGSPWGFWG